MKRPIQIGLLVLGLGVASAAPAMAGTIVNVGGGTWSYGTSFQAPWFKNVWSHYVNPTQYHSATAIGGPHNVKIYANAGSWANADTQCGSGESAAQYWNNY
ncbi:lactococcin 972 family bacteriocin [Arthrobacter sp. 2RAF6]|uniref:lactococcin 972 family bacteriocin n=1 Tax=Arthrobacter sp. 2RAF6 TaxID=3233002 RepID=UPI003F8FC03D